MATYKEIRGTQIEAVATDPSNPVEGQVWYNTTSNVLKGQAATAAGAWATLANMNQERTAVGGGGTKDASIVYGGQIVPGTYQSLTETWNGTSWTEVNNLNTLRSNLYGAGRTNTAVLAFGGLNTSQPDYNLKVVENWNGTNWTEVNDLNMQRYGLSGVGTNTAALAFGGAQFPSGPAPGVKAVTELWNGTNWTEVNDLNTVRNAAAGLGATYTNGLCIAGYDGSAGTAKVESWNGTNWTETTDLNATNQGQGSGGEYTTGLVWGGSTGNPATITANTEEWNGSNWTEVNNLNTGRRNISGAYAGSTSANLAFAGGPTPGSDTAGTEGWTGAGTGQTRTFDDS